MLLLTLYSILILFATQDIIRTLIWVFLTTTFFPRYKFFSYHLQFLTDASTSIQQPPSLTFFVSFADVVLLVLIYFLLTQRKKLFKPSRLKFEHILFLLIFVTGLISSHLAVFASHSFFFMFQLFKCFFIFFLLRDLIVQDQVYLRAVIEIILIFVGFNSLLIILQAFNGGPLGWAVEGVYGFRQFGDYTDEVFHLYRPGGMTTSPNEMATVIGMFIPFFGLLSLAKKTVVPRMVLLAITLISLAAVFFSMARAVWLCLLLVAAANFWFITRHKIKVKVPQFIKQYKHFLIFALVLALPFALMRLSTIVQTLTAEEGGWVYRLRHFQITLDYMDSLPFGLGVNNMQFKMIEDYEPEFYLHDVTPPHNIMAQIGASFGFVGLILWSALFYWIIRKGFFLIKNSDDENTILLVLASFSSCIMYLGVSQVHPWLVKKPIFYFFYLVLAILFAQEDNHVQSNT